MVNYSALSDEELVRLSQNNDTEAISDTARFHLQLLQPLPQTVRNVPTFLRRV